MHYGTTPFYARFGYAFKGHRVPFGASIGFLRFDRDTKAIRAHPFSEKVQKGLFMGYDLRPGG